MVNILVSHSPSEACSSLPGSLGNPCFLINSFHKQLTALDFLPGHPGCGCLSHCFSQGRRASSLQRSPTQFSCAQSWAVTQWTPQPAFGPCSAIPGATLWLCSCPWRHSPVWNFFPALPCPGAHSGGISPLWLPSGAELPLTPQNQPQAPSSQAGEEDPDTCWSIAGGGIIHVLKQWLLSYVCQIHTITSTCINLFLHRLLSLFWLSVPLPQLLTQIL